MSDGISMSSESKSQLTICVTQLSLPFDWSTALSSFPLPETTFMEKE